MQPSLMLQAAIGLLLGALLGLAFFGGLWYTVQQLPRARHPALLAMASFTGRLALALAGFYLVLKLGALPGIAGAAVGFLIVRVALTRTLSAAHRSDEGAP